VAPAVTIGTTVTPLPVMAVVVVPPPALASGRPVDDPWLQLDGSTSSLRLDPTITGILALDQRVSVLSLGD
jgi:hypothetical protein